MTSISAVIFFDKIEMVTVGQALYELTLNVPDDDLLLDDVCPWIRYIDGIHSRIKEIEKARKFYDEWGCEEHSVNFTLKQTHTILEALDVLIACEEAENAKVYHREVADRFQEYLRLLEEQAQPLEAT